MEKRLTIKEYFKLTSKSNKVGEYNSRYNSIKDKVVIKWYKLKDNGHLVMHFKVPSEKTPKLMYDTLIEFYTNNTSASSIKNSEIKVFSNCPSYVFMNARVAKNLNMDIDWANGLFSKETLAPPPEDKADSVPTEIRIERGLYFPMYHLKQLSDIEIMNNAKSAKTIPNGKMLAVFIRDSDWVMEKRGQYGTIKKIEKNISKLNPFKNTTQKSKMVTKTKKTPKVGSIKSITKR